MVERTWSRLANLPVSIDRVELRTLRRPVAQGFERVTTEVRIHGGEEVGIGEDVTYEAIDHEVWRALRGDVDLRGTFTFEALSARLDGLDLFPREPKRYASRQYRRWAIESAALDLALRQLEAPLALVLGREPRPPRFVVSLRLGTPPSIEPVDRLLRVNPNLRFKLDPTSDWSDSLCRALAALGRVDVLDLKGAYRGTPVDQAPDVALYERIVEFFETQWIEDPFLDRRTSKVLAPHRARITWDAPLHSTADLAALPFRPRKVNVKPSRFGTVRELMDVYDFCRDHEIGCYGGGQFELGVGRGQVQYLASLFHPEGPNDVAPAVYNDPEPGPDLPRSPLQPRLSATGFRWGDD